MRRPRAPAAWPTAVMTSLGAAAALGGYRLVGFLARPLAPLLLSWRAGKGKEDRDRLGERYGRASRERPPGRVVWIHAASVGETNSVIPLIERIVATGITVVLTTVTVTAAAISAERLPAGAIHQYSPIDTAAWVKAFLGHWRPDCAIFVESEIWPQTVLTLSAAGVPQLVVNGRLSPRSFAGWQRHASVAYALFSRIGLCLAQSERDAGHYRALGVPEVRVTGNLKFDTPPPAVDAAALAELKTAIAGRPVWVAASTHAGEEGAVAEAHRMVAARRPGALAILAPRHPDRGAAIAALLAGQGFTVARRGIGEPITPAVDIYVADTLGELGLFYSAAPVAFMGGSLIRHGGQNPIEPLRLGAAVLHGPHVQNFHEIYEAIDCDDGAVRVDDAAGIGDAVALILDDPALPGAAAARASAALGPFSGALDRTIEALGPWLDRRQRGGRTKAFEEVVPS